MHIYFFRNVSALLPAVLVWLFLSCDLTEKDEGPESSATIKFEFLHKVNSAPLEFDEIKYTNAAGNKYSVTRLEYYVSDFYFSGMGEQASDTVYRLDSVFYIDAKNESTHIHTVAGAPESHLHMGYFTFGLSPEKNETNALPDNPMNAGMVWPENMGGGYHHMKLEGEFMDGENKKPFKLHLGNTMGFEAHFQVDSLMLHAQPVSGYTLRIPIIMNIESWMNNPDFDLKQTPMTMMNKSAQEELIKSARKGAFEPGEVSVVQ